MLGSRHPSRVEALTEELPRHAASREGKAGWRRSREFLETAGYSMPKSCLNPDAYYFSTATGRA